MTVSRTFQDRGLSLDELREYFAYEADTGVIRWRRDFRVKGSHGTKRGKVAGILKPGGGYWMIMFRHNNLRAHRLAWFLHYGQEPPIEIDHKDGDRTNNRIANLRAATKRTNMHNTKRRSDNKSGFKGVTFERGRRKWRANIRVMGRSIVLGRFASPEEAHDAYVAAAYKYHGEFARAA
jgi:hypothetical protein